MPLLLILALAAADPPAEPVAAATAEIRQKVIDAIRACPESKGDEIVICSRDRGIAESYRLPKLDPRFAETDPKLKTTEEALDGVGDTGTGSCSAVGAGGAFGCAKRDYNDWGDWKRRQRAARQAQGGK
ncbi:hypothetical protein Q4F19_19295 [Sphingomonas sp. BIUV-7]|uniref:Uncharacterized protein n=1 Tax=Sphingomonas natans TaxID=3063330 RepID=A0ABT8YDW1_9SPHN|nr:hypothetical protein [Sphingomonas sp. BIUV-7]MDO6416537.1 hypothetical protein [Sphingomonas sp. BIUV-7]